MAPPGRPLGHVRRSGRVRTPTIKAQNQEHDEVSNEENAEGDERDAIEGITMFTGEPVGSVIGANKHAIEPLTAAYIEMTRTEAVPQRLTPKMTSCAVRVNANRWLLKFPGSSWSP